MGNRWVSHETRRGGGRGHCKWGFKLCPKIALFLTHYCKRHGSRMYFQEWTVNFIMPLSISCETMKLHFCLCKGASTLSSWHAVASRLAVPLGITDNSPVNLKVRHIKWASPSVPEYCNWLQRNLNNMPLPCLQRQMTLGGFPGVENWQLW